MVIMEKNIKDLADKTRAALLYDIYGRLLTDKANESMSLYLNEDWTISEIAAVLKISRQAVYDSLQRSLDNLERYEELLGLLRQHAILTDAADSLETAINNNNKADCLKQLALIREYI